MSMVILQILLFQRVIIFSAMVKQMKKPDYLMLIPALIILTFSACNDPVFYTISSEVPVIPAYIDGSPTNFVFFKDCVYVASGSSLYRYSAGTDGHGTWSGQIPVSGGWIGSLAATSSWLYAICLENSTGILMQSSDGTIWSKTPNVNYDVKAIFTTEENRLFFSANEGNDFYDIYYLSGTPIKVLENVKEFRGAVFNNGTYFICTTDGIYQFGNFSDEPVILQNSNGKNFVGIIDLGSDVAAIARNQELYSVSTGGIASIAKFDSRSASGALTVFKDSHGRRLLLVGRMDLTYSTTSGYTFGYIEIELDDDGFKHGAVYRMPGENPSYSTVDSNERFITTIGKNPVNHIFHVPSSLNYPDMSLIFASTQKNGVWSYRERGAIWQWNAEEER